MAPTVVKQPAVNSRSLSLLKPAADMLVRLCLIYVCCIRVLVLVSFLLQIQKQIYDPTKTESSEQVFVYI